MGIILWKALKACPDNLTVHTLAIKRASRLKDSLFEYELMDEKSL